MYQGVCKKRSGVINCELTTEHVLILIIDALPPWIKGVQCLVFATKPFFFLKQNDLALFAVIEERIFSLTTI